MTVDDHKQIRLVIIDDHAIVVRGLEVSLGVNEDILIVGSTTSSRAGIEMCASLQPDVLLVDLVMPEIDGIGVIEAVRKRSPDTHIVTLTTFKDAELVQGALEAGAISYILKNVSVDELVKAIRKAHEGESILAPEAAQVLIRKVTQPRPADYELTGRECEVLEELVSGKSNPEIADRLSISRSTVKNHVSSIIAKLNVSSRTEAATKALKLGLVKQ